jgi:uncharacterized small protein (DUF1192 family)
MYYGTPFETDEFESLLEDVEIDESDIEDSELDERARRGARGRLRPRLPLAKRGSPVPRKAGPGFATKAELVATANRLDGRIAVTTKSVAALDVRTRSLESEAARLSAELKKETLARKTEAEAFKKALDQQRTNGLLIHLLSQPTKTEVGGVKNVLVDNSSGLGAMLPILLMSGMGSSGGGLGGGGDSMLPLMAVAMSR